jgi:putative hydrolase of HD superfamily
MKIDNLIDFVRFTQEVQKVKRKVFVAGEDYRENDAEHSFQLALLGWYLIERDNLGLDRGKVLMLALVHDLLEVYAGDTSAFHPDYNTSAKTDRERAGIEKLIPQWPGWHSLRDVIEEYEAVETAEAKFVYSLDKLVPIANNLIDGGRAWHEQDVTLERMQAAKTGKIDRSPTVAQYYKDIEPILRQNPQIFANPKRSS